MLGLKIIATGLGMMVLTIIIYEKRKFLKRLRYIVEDQNVYDDYDEKIYDNEKDIAKRYNKSAI